jgi:hypothetical protein
MAQLGKAALEWAKGRTATGRIVVVGYKKNIDKNGVSAFLSYP